MTGRLPDFIIGGAPRSGTTWLASALDRHPDVWIARPIRPEPKFFLVDTLYSEGLDSYSERWFADAPEGSVVGEKSTNYLESDTVADRIAHDLPYVKMLFVLREPADRAVSNYRWSVMNGKEQEDFGTALDLEESREADLAPKLRYARPHAYFSRGCYARLLRAYYDRIPAERILVLRFEDLVTDPRRTTARALEFLGVPAQPDLIGEESGINASVPEPGIDPDTVARLRAAYAPLNQELVELVGPSFVSWDKEESTR